MKKKVTTKETYGGSKTLSKELINERVLAFGENMRNVRKERGFTAETLARFLSVSTAYIGLIERGERCPSLKTFLKICDFFGEDPVTMLTASSIGMSLREKNKKSESSSKNSLPRRHKMILGMLDTFDPVELEHIIQMIKSFKTFTQASKQSSEEN